MEHLSGLLSILVTILCLPSTRAFALIPVQRQPILKSSECHQSLVLLEMAKSRKAKKTVDQSRPGRPKKSFFDVMDEAEGKETKESSNSATATATHGARRQGESDDTVVDDRAEEARRKQVEMAKSRVDARPEVSTVIVDDETGAEIVQQGKNVMDVVTRRPVKLSTLGPEYRLAQMFPGVPLPVREKYRMDRTTAQVPEMVEKLREACMVRMADGKRAIPPHPSVANKAIDFVLANRDLLGSKMKRALARITMRNFALGNAEEGREYQKLWKNFETLENHISAPFRQMIMDAEGRAGPNFGNLEVKSFLSGDLYERTANYLVLKGMVAHWEKKVVDADSLEKQVQNNDNFVSITSEGDPRRFLPDSPVFFTVKECTQVCYMAQQTTKAFVETPELFDDLPPEVRFLEYALSIRAGTPMRRYMKEEFCPQEGITSEALVEGMRRLMVQLESMQVDPYADIVNLMEKLIRAMAVGMDEERDPYENVLVSTDPNAPGYFPTYTFNHQDISLVQFFDSCIANTGTGASASKSSNPFESLFNFGGGGGTASSTSKRGGTVFPKQSPETPKKDMYVVPSARAAGRPHELGWLDLMKDPDDQLQGLGKVPPGRIISETEEE
ncbi:hypothetical protein ACA910_021111 [Epithemia clementina (nom. ined.)]